MVAPNPLYARGAYDVARAFGVEIPDWVLQHFDLENDNLRLVEREPPAKGKIAPALQRALGFKPGGVELEYRRTLKHLAGSDEVYERNADGASNPFDPQRTRALEITDSYRIELNERMRAAVGRGGAHLTLQEKRSLSADAKRAVAVRFRVSLPTISRALRDYRESPSPVSRVSEDFELCRRSGMSINEAIAAIAGERGVSVSAIKAALHTQRAQSRRQK